MDESILKDVVISDLEIILKCLSDTSTNELSEIMSKYNSDKGYGLCNNYISNDIRPPNQVCHNYTFFYDYMFKACRDKSVNIFEMGIGVPPCMGVGSWAGSLLGWKEYFPNSTIYSADFDKNYLYNDERIKSFYVDQESEESIKDLWKSCLPNETFDFMLDDGPHTYSSQIVFYQNSIHKLKDKGIYIIEDIDTFFIDRLYNEIQSFNSQNSIDVEMVKLIIPWPKKFFHPHPHIERMNNLIVIKKK